MGLRRLAALDLLGAGGRLARRGACSSTGRATVLSQVGHELVHDGEVSAVYQLPAGSHHSNQTGLLQRLQMESQRGRYESDSFSNLPRWQSRRPLLDQESIDRQPMLVRQCAEGFNDLKCFHWNTIL